MPKRKTHEEFVKEVKDLVGEEYTVLSQYKNATTKVEMLHNTCNLPYTVLPSKFTSSGRRCPHCFGKNRLNIDVIRERVKDMVGDEYTVLSEEFKGVDSELLFIHNNCGEIFNKTFSDFKRGRRCKECAFNNRTINQRKTHEQFIDELHELYGSDEYQIIGRYVTNHDAVEAIHNKCGREISIMPADVLYRGKNRKSPYCPYCNHAIEVTIDEMQDRISELFGDEYILKKYNGSNKKCTIFHKVCKKESNVIPTNFLKSQGCSHCRSDISRGVRIIEKFLKSISIKYEKEKRLDGCVYKRQMPFDFCIKGTDNSIKLLIEYDGIQHYVPKFGEENLRETQLRDILKNEYCKDNNLNLIRIPYWFSKEEIEWEVFDQLVKCGLVIEV